MPVDIQLSLTNCQLQVEINTDDTSGKQAQLTVTIAGQPSLNRSLTLDRTPITVEFTDTPRTGKLHDCKASLTSSAGNATSGPFKLKLCAAGESLMQNFLLLPPRGISDNADHTPATQSFFRSLNVGVELNKIVKTPLSGHYKVLDSTGETGIKLIKCPETALAQLRQEQPGIRIVPERFYTMQRFLPPAPRQQAKKMAGIPTINSLRLRIVSQDNGNPLEGTRVIAFTKFDTEGDEGFTDANGEILLKGVGGRPLERLYIIPKLGHWSMLKRDFQVASGTELRLRPIQLDHIDVKRHFYPENTANFGRGVRVGVIDSGVGPHPDITLAGGRCLILGEDPNDVRDVDQHGTHVAGIIAGRGQSPNGVQGAAPKAELFAYRVFSKTSENASNTNIIKAIEQAIDDQCDLINMSLGGGNRDEAFEDAITLAFQNGIVCFVATGNDGRGPICFPASFSLSVAVGAMGRRGTFPNGTADTPNIIAPFGTDSEDFVAGFSNISSGADVVDLIGPGVAILSTVPGGYAPMSGTSMACPVVTGVAARLLSGRPDILNMPRDQARAEAIIQFVCGQATTLGFGAMFEGLGLVKA